MQKMCQGINKSGKYKRGYGLKCYGEGYREHKKPFEDSQANKSNFTYRVTSGSNPVLVIIDLNQGMSVTNNMKAVIAEIAADIGVDHRLLVMPIIYRDSEGIFDGVNLSLNGSVSFYPIVPGQRVTNEREAIQAVTQRKAGI